MADRRRWGLLALVVVALAGMTVHYGAVAPDRTPYTGPVGLAADHDAHVGTETYFWARVTAVEADGVRVDTQDLSVRTDRSDLAVGDVVQVYGTVEPDGRVDARRIVVSPPLNLRYLFAVSGLAALLVTGAVLRYWRLDPRTLTVRPREDER